MLALACTAHTYVSKRALGALLVELMGWSRTTVAFDGVHLRPMVETIGTRFGGIPQGFPSIHIPAFRPDLILPLLPSALTVAILAASSHARGRTSPGASTSFTRP